MYHCCLPFAACTSYYVIARNGQTRSLLLWLHNSAQIQHVCGVVVSTRAFSAHCLGDFTNHSDLPGTHEVPTLNRTSHTCAYKRATTQAFYKPKSAVHCICCLPQAAHGQPTPNIAMTRLQSLLLAAFVTLAVYPGARALAHLEHNVRLLELHTCSHGRSAHVQCSARCCLSAPKANVRQSPPFWSAD